MALVTPDLEALKEQLRLAIHFEALVCCYRHNEQRFSWLQPEDKNHIRGELEMIRCYLNSGRVTSVEKGQSVVIDDVPTLHPGKGLTTRAFLSHEVTLYTMAVNFRGVKCTAHMLLCQMNQVLDLSVTPYYFLEKEDRDNAVKFVNSKFRVKMTQKAFSPGG